MAVSSTKGGKGRQASEESIPAAGAEDEIGEEEYDVDQILDAKKGVYAPGRWAFQVSWKGYGPEDNSWVDEPDFTATDMIETFWRENLQIKGNPLAKKPRKSGASSSVGGRPSKARTEEASDEEAPAAKRGKRKTKTEADDDAMDIAEAPPPKKSKSQSLKNKSITPDNGIENGHHDDELAAHSPNAMGKHMDKKSWEHLVASIETVERSADDEETLLVYFTTNEGTHAICNSTILAEKAPKKLIEFYEGNLRWQAGKK